MFRDSCGPPPLRPAIPGAPLFFRPTAAKLQEMIASASRSLIDKYQGAPNRRSAWPRPWWEPSPAATSRLFTWPHHILACPRLAPDVGEAEKGERGTIRLRMVGPV